MAAPRLASYVQQQINAGYDMNTIRNYLIRNGYDSREIDTAINFAQGVKPAANIPWIPIIGIVAVLGLIIGVTMIFIGGDEEAPAQLLDLETSATASEYDAGDTINFNIELISMGKTKRYDVVLDFELINSIGNILNSKRETMALETRASKPSQILIPEDASSGTYTVRTTATYNGEEALSFFTVKVQAEEVQEEEETTSPPIIITPEEPIDETPIELIEANCPLTCDDFDQCTADLCNAATNYQCVNQDIKPCCGNRQCDVGESYDNCPSDCDFVQQTATTVSTVRDVIDEVTNLAGNPGEAQLYCDGIEKASYKDSCFTTLAKETNTNSFCDPIVSESKRDNCYTNFALSGDYTVCDNIGNKYLKQSCVALSQTA